MIKEVKSKTLYIDRQNMFNFGIFIWKMNLFFD